MLLPFVVRKIPTYGSAVVMPNHFHGIIFINGRGEASAAPAMNAPPTEWRMLRPYGLAAKMAGHSYIALITAAPWRVPTRIIGTRGYKMN